MVVVAVKGRASGLQGRRPLPLTDTYALYAINLGAMQLPPCLAASVVVRL